MQTKEDAIRELDETELWCLAHEIKFRLAEKISNFPTVLDRTLHEVVTDMKESLT